MFSTAVEALLYAESMGKRVRVFYGDPETGRDWMEECDVLGYFGSTYLVDNTLKVMETQSKRILYQHPNYQPPELTIAEPPKRIGKSDLAAEGYVAGVYRNGDNVANFKSWRKAETWIAFMRGERMNWG